MFHRVMAHLLWTRYWGFLSVSATKIQENKAGNVDCNSFIALVCLPELQVVKRKCPKNFNWRPVLEQSTEENVIYRPDRRWG